VTDSSSKPTKGKILSYSAPAYATPSLTNNTAANGDVTFTLSAKHSVHITSTITSGSGKTNNVVWSQSVQFSNTQSYLNNSFHQVGYPSLMPIGISLNYCFFLDCQADFNRQRPLSAQWRADRDGQLQFPTYD
jgi:hypothetical protein